MALGQYIAGMGFSNVGLGIVHSMAHALGAVYDTPHGVANAILLPTVMEYNAPFTGDKYKYIAKAMGVEGVENMTQEEYRKAAVDANFLQMLVFLQISRKLQKKMMFSSYLNQLMLMHAVLVTQETHQLKKLQHYIAHLCNFTKLCYCNR